MAVSPNLKNKTCHLRLKTQESKSHLAHLIASLPATDVNDDVGVGILAQGLGNDLKYQIHQFCSYICSFR